MGFRWDRTSTFDPVFWLNTATEPGQNAQALKVSRLGEKTRIQSTTGAILCFLFFSPSNIPQPGLRVIQYTEVETEHIQSSKTNLLVLVRGLRKWTPNAQSEGNSFVSPLFSVLSHLSSQVILPVSEWHQWLRWQWGPAGTKILKEGKLLLWSEELWS